eukprot:14166638-Alexandrium_andersonii.AAC.1
MEPCRLRATSHGRLLRLLSLKADRRFQGLSQAARFPKKDLSASRRRFLLGLEMAFDVARH